MGSRRRNERVLDSAKLGFWWQWIFCLGFATAGVPDDRSRQRGRALRALGGILPWVIIPAVLIWSEVYQLGFWGMLAMLELQSLVIAGALTLFAPRRSLALARDVAVNAFVAMLLVFLAVLALSFVFGFIVLIISEGEFD